jgi:hypothetical protein
MQRDDQLHTYEAIAEDSGDGAVFHLLRNDRWVVDSRLPPRGLRPDIETDPVGDRYTLQGNGTWPHFDATSYAFDGRDDIADATPSDPNDDQLELRVRLLYLINTPEYVEFLADENRTNDAGNHVAMLFDTAGGATPLVLAEQSLSIPITGFGSADDTSSTLDDTSSDPTNPTTTPDSTTDGTGTETTPQNDDGGGNGCGCTTPNRHGSGWLLLLFPLLLRRRS